MNTNKKTFVNVKNSNESAERIEKGGRKKMKLNGKVE